MTVQPDISPELAAELEAYVRQEHIDVPLGELPSELAEKELAAAHLQAESKGVRQISDRISRGDPAEEIICAAQREKADLIVVGSRGHGRLAGLLLVSVRVVGGNSAVSARRAECPSTWSPARA